MNKGFNQIIRNVTASLIAGGSEFNTRLIKATFHGDTEEPKEKHVIFILECF